MKPFLYRPDHPGGFAANVSTAFDLESSILGCLPTEYGIHSSAATSTQAADAVAWEKPNAQKATAKQRNQSWGATLKWSNFGLADRQQ
tara:strand:- start:129 stop:392 length:264 start_codon:yes stop_codon:yes gene_type:complete